MRNSANPPTPQGLGEVAEFLPQSPNDTRRQSLPTVGAAEGVNSENCFERPKEKYGIYAKIPG